MEVRGRAIWTRLFGMESSTTAKLEQIKTRFPLDRDRLPLDTNLFVALASDETQCFLLLWRRKIEFIVVVVVKVHRHDGVTVTTSLKPSQVTNFESWGKSQLELPFMTTLFCIVCPDPSFGRWLWGSVIFSMDHSWPIALYYSRSSVGFYATKLPASVRHWYAHELRVRWRI